MTARKKAQPSVDQTSIKPTAVVDDYKGVERIMGGKRDVMVDSFKLEPATMRKNVSWTEVENLVPIEHCHIYHTYDSSGKALIDCNSVGGHKHELQVSVIEGKFDVRCSPPIQNKKSETISANDHHVHTVSYLKSEQLVMRKLNADAIKVSSSFYTPDTVAAPSTSL